ncbi:hypothetical protein ACOME3_010224 [Neoechinorhynchus agilis]
MPPTFFAKVAIHSLDPEINTNDLSHDYFHSHSHLIIEYYREIIDHLALEGACRSYFENCLFQDENSIINLSNASVLKTPTPETSFNFLKYTKSSADSQYKVNLRSKRRPRWNSINPNGKQSTYQCEIMKIAQWCLRMPSVRNACGPAHGQSSPRVKMDRLQRRNRCKDSEHHHRDNRESNIVLPDLDVDRKFEDDGSDVRFVFRLVIPFFVFACIATRLWITLFSNCE